MARVFCTLKEAAAWLNTSESNVRGMLDEGLVPEFRDGNSRLLRISDVRDMAQSQSQDDRLCSEPEPAFGFESPLANEPQEAPAMEIRLPRTSVAVLESPVDDAEPSAQWDAVPLRSTDELDWRLDQSDPASDHETPVCRAKIDNAPDSWHESSAGPSPASRGLWMGIIDDRPLAILGVSALAMAIAAALGSAIYVLIRFLR